MAEVYDHFPWNLWPPAVSLALCGIPALQQAGTLRYTGTGKQVNKQACTQTVILQVWSVFMKLICPNIGLTISTY